MKKTILKYGLIASLALTFVPVAARAMVPADSQNIDGENGSLFVHGVLTESACRLDMASSYQDIWLGHLATGELNRPGDETSPVAVQLKLHDCVRQSGHVRDARKGTLTWGALQPVATVSFVAPADNENSRLVKITGAGGFGLRIVDVQHRPVWLGSRSTPLYLSPGENQLTYYISAQRTSAPLQPGLWQGRVDFRLNYD